MSAMITELLNADFLNICDKVVGAALNGLWQGVVITLLVAIGLRLAGSINAATRHAVWLVTLVLAALLIPAQLLREVQLAWQRPSAAAARVEKKAPQDDGKKNKAAPVPQRVPETVAAPATTTAVEITLLGEDLEVLADKFQLEVACDSDPVDACDPTCKDTVGENSESSLTPISK